MDLSYCKIFFKVTLFTGSSGPTLGSEMGDLRGMLGEVTLNLILFILFHNKHFLNILALLFMPIRTKFTHQFVH